MIDQQLTTIPYLSFLGARAPLEPLDEKEKAKDKVKAKKFRNSMILL